MKHTYKKGDKYLLSIGGDEFDDDTFTQVKSTFNVYYVGVRDYKERGVTSNLHEFDIKDDYLLYKNGISVGRKLFITLGDFNYNGTTARVSIFDEENKKLPVGRALLKGCN